VDHLGVAPSLPELQLSLPNVPLPENPREIRELASGYLVHAVQRRFSHARFRSAVLRVYRDRCAVCLLGLRPLLDAARITPGDDDGAGELRHGVSLCAVHLRAFQAGILTWDAAYIVRIRLGHTIAGEGERSMLLSFDGKPLALPRDERHWPAVPEGGEP
jgi:predicted restriction endonuclease